MPVIKCLVKKGLIPTDIFNEKKNVLGDFGPSITAVKKWTAEFKHSARGCTSLEDDS